MMTEGQSDTAIFNQLANNAPELLVVNMAIWSLGPVCQLRQEALAAHNPGATYVMDATHLYRESAAIAIAFEQAVCEAFRSTGIKEWPRGSNYFARFVKLSLVLNTAALACARLGGISEADADRLIEAACNAVAPLADHLLNGPKKP